MTSEPAAPVLVSVRRAAELLDVSVDTVRRLIAAGDLDAVRLGYRTLRVPVSSLSQLVARRNSA